MTVISEWFKDVDEEWLDKWFRRFQGHGRELTLRTPSSTIHEYLHSEMTFKRRVIESVKYDYAVAMSVNCFKGERLLSALDKLFFDFDDKVSPQKAVAEAWVFASRIENLHGIKPMVVDSANKGAHVYVWFPPKVISSAVDVEESYHFLHSMLNESVCLLTGYGSFSDLARDFKRWERGWSASPRWKSKVPYSKHPKSGKRLEVYNPDELYSKDFLPKEILHTAATTAIEKYDKYEQRASESSYKNGMGNRNIRPCIVRAMSEDEPSHHARLAWALDAVYAGKTLEEMQGFCKHYRDYDEGITRRQLERTVEKVHAGVRPIPCEKLKDWGLCDMSCKQKMGEVGW
jgi:hypothetical protein